MAVAEASRFRRRARKRRASRVPSRAQRRASTPRPPAGAILLYRSALRRLASEFAAGVNDVLADGLPDARLGAPNAAYRVVGVPARVDEDERPVRVEAGEDVVLYPVPRPLPYERGLRLLARLDRVVDDDQAEAAAGELAADAARDEPAVAALDLPLLLPVRLLRELEPRRRGELPNVARLLRRERLRVGAEQDAAVGPPAEVPDDRMPGRGRLPMPDRHGEPAERLGPPRAERLVQHGNERLEVERTARARVERDDEVRQREAREVRGVRVRREVVLPPLPLVPLKPADGRVRREGHPPRGRESKGQGHVSFAAR